MVARTRTLSMAYECVGDGVGDGVKSAVIIDNFQLCKFAEIKWLG